MIILRRVDQTTFGTDWEADDCGNCLQACLATVLGLPLEDVPHFVHLYGDEWLQEMQKWLRPRGLGVMRAEEGTKPEGFQLMNGQSPRGDFGHVIVSQDGQHYHDPHPSREGVVGEVYYYVFIALNPSWLGAK